MSYWCKNVVEKEKKSLQQTFQWSANTGVDSSNGQKTLMEGEWLSLQPQTTVHSTQETRRDRGRTRFINCLMNPDFYFYFFTNGSALYGFVFCNAEIKRSGQEKKRIKVG